MSEWKEEESKVQMTKSELSIRIARPSRQPTWANVQMYLCSPDAGYAGLQELAKSGR